MADSVVEVIDLSSDTEEFSDDNSLELVIGNDLPSVGFCVEDFISDVMRLSRIPYLDCNTCGTAMTKMREIAGHPHIAIVMCNPCLSWWRCMEEIGRLEVRRFVFVRSVLCFLDVQ